MKLVETPWSYSALEAFETCPLNFYWTRVHKPSRGEPYSAAKAGGIDVHAQMQDYVERGKEPPLALTKFRTVVDKLVTDAVDITCEIQFGLRPDLSWCQFFDADVSLRVKFDLNILRPDAIAQLDFKTSKQPRESNLQLRLYALAGLQRWPRYDTVHSAFLYTHHDARATTTQRSDIPEILSAVNPRVERLRLARVEEDWPARSSWKCNGFCPVTECRFNKPKKR